MIYTAPVAMRPGGVWGRYPSGGVHNALDYPVAIGTAVHAAGPGVISLAGWSTSGFGNHIRLLLDDGNTVIYGHLSSFAVHTGQRVVAGQVIGYSGNSGNSTGPHLHMEVRRVSFDPSTSWDFTSKIGYPQTGSTVPAFNLNSLKYKANNSEVKRFQQWLWCKQGTGYQAAFRKNVYNFDAKGFTTLYGDATARMVQDTYRYLAQTYPNGGWKAGWVNGVPPKEPGPGFIAHYGGRGYRA